MLKIEKKLDMFAGAVPVVVYVSQYDSDFEIEFSLYSSQDAFTIESGTTAQVRGTKKDGNGYSVDATLSGSKVTVTGDQQMTACAGEQCFELTLRKGEKELNTCNFILSVERAALDKDTLPSKSVIRELVNVIDRTDEIIEAAQQADEAVEQAASLVAQTEANATRAEEAADTAETAYQNALGKVQEILDSNAATDKLSLEALAKATNAENEMADLGNNVDALGRRVGAMELAQEGYVDDGFVENGVAYFTHNGTVLFEITGIGGGGGGGQGGNNAKLTVTNKSGFLSKTIADGAGCAVSVEWSSIEDEMPTGDGTLRITVNGGVRESRQIQQGEVTVEIAKYCNVGSNVVKVTVEDVYGNSRTISFSITVIALSISSSFDASTPVTGSFSFPYTPVGAVQKTIHFLVDGHEIGTQTTAVSGRQMSYAIPAQSHGAHTLTVYFEAEINGETVQSNTLYYDMICLVAGNHDTVIASPFKTTEAEQYTSLIIPFTVYDPDELTVEVTISVNNEVVSTQTVDRTQQSYTYRADAVGTLSIKIESGEASKTFTVAITESQIDVHAETQDLVLHLTSQGRSNSEAHPEVWEDGAITASLTGFNFTSDGWQKDADGITVLRAAGDARVTIPYKAFAQDFRTTGKTIEVEFATRNVLNYDAVLLSCMDEGRGLSITAQRALLKSEQSEISTQYKEDEHVRVAFVVEKKTEHRLVYIYINGIASGVIQYPEDDDFAQLTPADIQIGSSDCTIDIYRIRVYDNDLTRNQILDNWIADTQNGGMMLERYLRNNVYDAYGNVVISKLPAGLPYLILNAAQLPQYKGDKKTVSGSYTDPVHPEKSFTFEGAQADVQGTSSQYYPRKNYKIKFNGGFKMQNGAQASKYAMNADAIAVKTFTFKADVASSEGANNVELARLYNDAIPYKTPAQEKNAKVRQGIDGFPIVIFWNDGESTKFVGKYNFNNDKGTEEVFGFVEGDESWEIKNNTGERVIWKSDDYRGADWLNDFEARYPDTDPPYVDPSQLKEFATWAASTDRDAATNEPLPSSVTYGEGDDAVTYTHDTAAYRLAKFKAEAGNYMELDSAMFYYLFTELFLMVDSRAKNAFPSFMGTEVVK